MLSKEKVIRLSCLGIPKEFEIGMEITLNNQKLIISEEESLQDLVFAQLGEKQNGIAIAVNNAVVPKKDWSSTHLNENDSILIIKATQGG